MTLFDYSGLVATSVITERHGRQCCQLSPTLLRQTNFKIPSGSAKFFSQRILT